LAHALHLDEGMECAERLYHQRNPKASPLYRLFDEHFEDLKRNARE
jgi:hypothetical protein